MPGGDGTGPAGLGAMTGRGAGYCAGYSVPGSINPVGWGGFWGWGRGRGGGRRWPGRFYARGLAGWQGAPMGWLGFGGVRPPVVGPYAPAMGREQQIDALKGQAEYLEDALDGIRKRIEELESKKD